MKKSVGLGFKLGAVFSVFLIVTLVLCGIMTYVSQMAIYRNQCQRNMTSVTSYLASLIEADGQDFLDYKEYYEDHYAEVDIPIDASEYLSYEARFNELFASRYPGKAFGKDITIFDCDEDVQHAWFIYTHLYWLLTFERARADFN
nr:hypothetical protein [Lachnospiraceae bacterium]